MENSGAKILLQGTQNTRDLGGYKTQGGKTVAYRRLIRSGELLSLTEQDKHILFEDYKVKTIIDFRTGLERAKKPDPQYPGVENIFNPILSEEIVGISTGEDSKAQDPLESFFNHAAGLRDNPRPYIDQLYRDLIHNSFAADHYRAFFDHLLDRGALGAVLWHCSAGKDRAGFGTALLLTALGVDRKTVIADYVKTNECMKEEIDAITALALQRTGDEQTARAVRILDSVSGEYLEAAFAEIEDTYITVDAYLETALGLSQEKRLRLKEMYLI